MIFRVIAYTFEIKYPHFCFSQIFQIRKFSRKSSSPEKTGDIDMEKKSRYFQSVNLKVARAQRRNRLIASGSWQLADYLNANTMMYRGHIVPHSVILQFNLRASLYFHSAGEFQARDNEGEFNGNSGSIIVTLLNLCASSRLCRDSSVLPKSGHMSLAPRTRRYTLTLCNCTLRYQTQCIIYQHQSSLSYSLGL